MGSVVDGIGDTLSDIWPKLKTGASNVYNTVDRINPLDWGDVGDAWNFFSLDYFKDKKQSETKIPEAPKRTTDLTDARIQEAAKARELTEKAKQGLNSTFLTGTRGTASKPKSLLGQ